MNNSANKIHSIQKKLINTGFLHIFGSSSINQIIGFLSGILLVRIISKIDYGVFSYTNNILSFFALLSGLGVTSGILQICSEKANDRDMAFEIYKFGFRYGFKANIVLSISIFLFAVFVPLQFSKANQLLMIMSITPMVTVVFELIQVYFRYNRANKKFAFFSTSNTAIILIFSIIGAILWSVKGLIVLRYVGYTLSISLGVIALRFPLTEMMKKKSKKSINDAIKEDLLRLSRLSMANNATAHLIYILDIFIIGMLIFDESIIATYKVATIIPNALVFIPNSLMIYLYPYFAKNRNNKTWVIKHFNLLIRYFGFFNLVVSLILIVCAPWIIKIIFSEQYLNAVLPFRILIAGFFVSSTFRKIVGNLLVTQRKLKFNFWLGISEGILNLVLNIFFILRFGFVGAAVASLIVVTVSSIISFFYFIKVIKE